MSEKSSLIFPEYFGIITHRTNVRVDFMYMGTRYVLVILPIGAYAISAHYAGRSSEVNECTTQVHMLVRALFLSCLKTEVAPLVLFPGDRKARCSSGR